MTEKKKSVYEVLSRIDLKEHLAKKGQFDYLSWSDAVDILLTHYPESTWETTKWNGLPYCQTEAGAFVEVSVTVEGITRSHIHPVLDFRNKAIVKPNAFDINTATARCLAKCIALFGLSLYVFRGEDLPPSDVVGNESMDTKPVSQDRVKAAAEYFKKKIDADIDEEIKAQALKDFNDKLTNDEKIQVQGLLKDKAPDSNRIYSTILKDYLKEQ